MNIITDICVAAAKKGHRFGKSSPSPFALELEITRRHKEMRDKDPVQREMGILTLMFPDIFQPLQQGDLLAGRILYPLVGFSPEPMDFGYYCLGQQLLAAVEERQIAPHLKTEVLAMVDYWNTERSVRKTRDRMSAKVAKTLPSDNWQTESGSAFPLYRMGGTQLDYEKLLSLGIPGMRDHIISSFQKTSDVNAIQLKEGMLSALQLLTNSLKHYAEEASIRSAKDPAWQELSDVLNAIQTRKPQTLREAMQLMWIYALMSGTWNYGRMDDVMGPYLEADIKEGRLNKESALELIMSLWKLMFGYANAWNNRIMLGGKGRKNGRSADAFALLAMEASRRLRLNQPQLSLRFCKGQNDALMTKAIDCIGEGITYPILYNDDINIPAVQNAFKLGITEAEQYVPYGCGEYIIDHRSVGTPNGVINLTKCLEIVLHKGTDPLTGRKSGLAESYQDIFTNFDELWNAYKKEVELNLDSLAEFQKLTYDMAAEEAPFLFLSMLHDDCIARNKPIFDGGIRYLGGTIETYGNTNAADSLTALDEMLFHKKIPLCNLVQALDANFNGHEGLHKELLDLPKYGNDNDTADSMLTRVHDHVCQYARSLAQKNGLHSYLVVVINNNANTLLGMNTSASADGRKARIHLANANNPFPGSDKNGVTAFLNSLVKPSVMSHAGAVQNMKFNPAWFKTDRPKFESLLRTYFKKGAAQAMITVVNRGDLEAALREPVKWGHLMVRVGGFSARFVDLPAEVQREILERTVN